MSAKTTTRWALLLAPMLLAGCNDSMMKTLGLQRDPPDEFQVTTQPLLAMPNNLDAAAAALPQPTPGVNRPQDVAIRQQAADAMMGGAAINNTAASTQGDAALVQQAGPAAPADIRQDVNALGAKDVRSRTTGNRINPFGSKVQPKATVDATAERQRLQENEALGRSPAAGATPLVKPSTKGPLGDLLNSVF